MWFRTRRAWGPMIKCPTTRTQVSGFLIDTLCGTGLMKHLKGATVAGDNISGLQSVGGDPCQLCSAREMCDPPSRDRGASGLLAARSLRSRQTWSLCVISKVFVAPLCGFRPRSILHTASWSSRSALAESACSSMTPFVRGHPTQRLHCGACMFGRPRNACSKAAPAMTHIASMPAVCNCSQHACLCQ
jgi:hypothetical protein